MLRNRGLVQLVSPCNEEQLVVDVHAVLFGLRARAVLAIRPLSAHGGRGRWLSPHRRGTCTCRAGSRGSGGHFLRSCSRRERPVCSTRSASLFGQFSSEGLPCAGSVARSGEGAALTHSKPSSPLEQPCSSYSARRRGEASNKVVTGGPGELRAPGTTGHAPRAAVR